MLHTIYQSETMREVRTIVGWVKGNPGLIKWLIVICGIAALRNI